MATCIIYRVKVNMLDFDDGDDRWKFFAYSFFLIFLFRHCDWLFVFEDYRTNW